MRCSTGQHRFYAGVDLHARAMYTHVLDATGTTVFAKDLPTDPAAFLDALAPFRPDWWSGSSACPPGTGWPTCARTRGSRSPSAMPSA